MIRTEFTARAGSRVTLAAEAVPGITIHQAVHSEDTTYEGAELSLRRVTFMISDGTALMRGEYEIQVSGDRSLEDVQINQDLTQMVIPASAVEAMQQEDGSLIIPLTAFVQIIDASFLQVEPQLTGGELV